MNEKIVKSSVIEQENKLKLVKFAKDLFAAWDLDGEGLIDNSDMTKNLVQYFIAPNLAQAELIIQAFDTHSQKMTMDEFLRILRQDLVI